MDDLADIRRQVKRVFELRDINLKPDALTFLTNFMKDKDYDGMKEFSRKLVDTFIAKKIDDEAITLEKLKLCLKNDKDEKATFEVINFLDHDSENQSMSAESLEYADPLRNRFSNIKSRVDSISITPIELLYSRTRAVVTVLGMLCKSPGNKFTIEDDTGTLKTKLDEAKFSDGIFFEGGIYEFHGVYQSGILQVETISLPKLRKEDKVSKGINTNWSSNEAIIAISDIWLDNSDSLKRIYKILQGFATNAPYMFILSGDFLSRQYQEDVTFKINKAFEHLANILLEFKHEYSKTQFVIVPSNNDFPMSTALPREELPFHQRYFKEFNNVHFTSNPTMIKAKNMSFYVIRDDLVEGACRSAIKAPINTTEISSQFCKTILSQRHVSPLPIYYSPKILHKDGLFQLNTLPDVVIIADKYESFVYQDEINKCQIINPGSFSTSGYEFIVYYPKNQAVEQSSCP